MRSDAGSGEPRRGEAGEGREGERKSDLLRVLRPLRSFAVRRSVGGLASGARCVGGMYLGRGF